MGAPPLRRPSLTLERFEHGDLFRRQGITLDRLQMRGLRQPAIHGDRPTGSRIMLYLGYGTTVPYYAGGGDRRYAAERLRPGETLSETGRKYRSWQRQAARAIEAGKKLQEGSEPPLLHPARRKEVEASLGRIRNAAALDGLPPRFIIDGRPSPTGRRQLAATGSSSPATRTSATGWTGSGRTTTRPEPSPTGRPSNAC